MSESLLLQGVFSGHVAFSQLIREALDVAARQGWKKMIWSDINFEDWPLHEKAVSDSLYAWSKTGNQLILLAKNYDSILKYKPRMVTWRQKWNHIVDARVCRQVENDDFPSVLWSPEWFMQRQELETSQGFATQFASKRVQCYEQLQVIYQRSTPGFPATVLGL